MREQLKITGLLAFVVVLYIIGGYIDAWMAPESI
jgi:hypothetical protein